MSLFSLKKTYQVRPNQAGYLYRNNVFKQALPAGRHEISDWRNRTFMVTVPTVSKLITITNQEVLSKDNIALRFSYTIRYHIADGLIFLSHHDFQHTVDQTVHHLEAQLAAICQVPVRNRIAALESEVMNEKRAELVDFELTDVQNSVRGLGIVVEQIDLRDLTFPKAIQDLFARQLEAKIRAKADLENARTVVATSRALKNAADLMKDDTNIRFFQMMEMITKIAAKGKHTFVVGDMQQLTKTTP
ncbi:slipin family protein [Fibrella aquatilis]|uniref:Slipin family protein n=1 Tax=Fibrella aquatilis TaxID=2817059 RepID=A0A939JZ66_9BACT|nr:slipin family protein [Fibrella aquatilis]MBO0931103.1 slipin family protein [Fibrella aquatilis]